jgi:ABC-2 type transport system permease protein
MAAFEIARVNLLRVLRDRTNLFFVFLLPLIIIVALGAAFGGSGTVRVGIVRAGAGPLGEALVDGVQEGALEVELRERSTLDQLRQAVESGELAFGLAIPSGYDEALRSGQDVEVSMVSRQDDLLPAMRQVVQAAVARQSAQLRAARIAADHAGIGFDEALEAARARQAEADGIAVRVTTLGQATFPSGGNVFALGAQSQTILFMFLTSMTAASQLILTRQLGVSRRMLSTPTRVRSILLGELGGRFSIAMMQALFIVLVSSLAFGVGWGDPAGAAIVVVLFALVGTGAAMTVGVFARNADQASALGVVLGMVLGALGGAMVPLELFDEPLSSLARLTPHAWAIDALRDLVYQDAGVVDILRQLSVLVVYAGALVLLGIWGLRRSLTRG